MRHRLRVLIVCLVAAAGTSAWAVSPPTIHVDDWNNDGVEDCNAFDGPDDTDDTACWQNALNAGRPASGAFPDFGTVEATGGGHYFIKDTVVLNRAFGGVIQGNGAVLHWWGGSGSISMLRFEDTQQLAIRNLRIHSEPSHPLDTAIEFTNAPNLPANDPYNQVAPIANILDHIEISGTDTGGLKFGIRFSNRYGIDQNNDQSTIMNSTIGGVMHAAISIEHSQSHQHRFIAVNGYAAAGNENAYIDESSTDVPPNNLVYGASFVRLKGGGFTSIGGFRHNFKNAEFYLASIFSPVTIIDSNSEGCARFLRSAWGSGWSPTDVHVYSGRFALEGLAADGRVVNWSRQGPLTIRGMAFNGQPPSGVEPVIYLSAPGPAPGEAVNQAQFEIVNNSFYFSGAAGTERIVANEHARVTAHGNMCVTAAGMNACPGLGVGMIGAATGFNQGELASLNVVAGHTTYCKDCTPHTTPCAPGGSGAWASRLGGTWDCGGGVVLASNTAVTYDSDWDSVAEINAATTDADVATLAGAETLTNKNLTAPTNTFPATAVLGFAVVNPGTTQKYAGPNTAPDDAAESNVALRVPTLKARNLSCKATVAPGAGKTWTVTLRDDAAATALSCPIAGTVTTCTNVSNVVSIADGSLVALEVKKTAGSGSFPTSTVRCTVETRPN